MYDGFHGGGSVSLSSSGVYHRAIELENLYPKDP